MTTTTTIITTTKTTEQKGEITLCCSKGKEANSVVSVFKRKAGTI